MCMRGRACVQLQEEHPSGVEEVCGHRFIRPDRPLRGGRCDTCSKPLLFRMCVQCTGEPPATAQHNVVGCLAFRMQLHQPSEVPSSCDPPVPDASAQGAVSTCDQPPISLHSLPRSLPPTALRSVQRRDSHSSTFAAVHATEHSTSSPLLRSVCVTTLVSTTAHAATQTH